MLANADCNPAAADMELEPSSSHREGRKLVLEVPAGRWETLVLADNDQGTNFMCHTLISNRSVTFDEQGEKITHLMSAEGGGWTLFI